MYAGFWRRVVAVLIDGVIIGAAFGIVAAILNIGVRDASYQALQTLAYWLYFALMESSDRQATLGKIALQIRVTDLQGNRISFGTATLRYFAKILSGLILGIGFLMAAFTAKKQALHDMIASTLVVKAGATAPATGQPMPTTGEGQPAPTDATPPEHQPPSSP